MHRAFLKNILGALILAAQVSDRKHIAKMLYREAFHVRVELWLDEAYRMAIEKEARPHEETKE